jgi:hypothetical protein
MPKPSMPSLRRSDGEGDIGAWRRGGGRHVEQIEITITVASEQSVPGAQILHINTVWVKFH